MNRSVASVRFAKLCGRGAKRRALIRFIGARALLAAAGTWVGLSFDVDVHNRFWARVYQAFITSEQRPYMKYVHARDVETGQRHHAIVVQIPGSRNYRGKLLKFVPGCTFQQIALGAWPLFITVWRPWPIVRAALVAAALAFGLNFWRLYMLHQLVWWWDVPWPWADLLLTWSSGGAAFAIGLWYMWRTARRQAEKPSAHKPLAARAPAPI